MESVELKNIYKSYFDKEVLHDINFYCERGEFFCLLGPSGAGKTTTLKVIAGIAPINNGEIFIGDQCVNGLIPRDRDVEMVFESYALFSHLSVFENIAFPLKVPKRKKFFSKKDIYSKVYQYASLLQIDELLERKVTQLSGGQRQRVALARVLVREPRIYLMDEPIAHLDAKLRHRMRGELKQIQKEKEITTIYASPDYLDALSLADHMVVINNGYIEQVGTPDEIYNHPINKFVASLMGDPPMNFIDLEYCIEGNEHFLKNKAISLTIKNKKLQNLLQKNNLKTITMGVRSNSIKCYENSVNNVFLAEVYVSERIGRNILVTLKVGEDFLKHKVEASTDIQIGTKLWVEVDSENLFLFNPDTQKTLF